jgi:ABC-type Fe3+ transport system permease subunit
MMVLVLMIAALPLVIPLLGLCVQAGQTATGWSPVQLIIECCHQAERSGAMLLASVTVAACAGLLVALLSLIGLWWARGRESRQRLLWGFALFFWTLPGPLLGLALLQFILWLLATPLGPALRPVLWDGPSPLPTLWAQILRLWPVGLALMAPATALLPRTWEEEARLTGAGTWPVFWLSFGRPLMPAAAATGLAVALLSLGELSTSKLVTTPGFLPLAQHLFMQMHAAADAEVASLALLLLAVVASVATGLVLMFTLAARRWHFS